MFVYYFIYNFKALKFNEYNGYMSCTIMASNKIEEISLLKINCVDLKINENILFL